MNDAIQIVGLSKQYDRSTGLALNKLSLSVKPGEVYGFLGPNGAGKSTTIRILMGLLRSTQGTVNILGQTVSPGNTRIKQHIGYVSGDMTMYPRMTGKQYLQYMSELRKPVSSAYRQELIKRLQCTTSKKLGELSRGNRQKIALVQAFMSKPEVLILDEPTSGLDPLMQDVFYELIDEARARGASIFMSSHILSEVQKVCDRVGIIRAGKLVVERDIAEMNKQASQTFIVKFRDEVPVSELTKIAGLKLITHTSDTVQFHIAGDLSKLLSLLANKHVVSLETHELDVEELFMHYYQLGAPS